MKFKFRLLSCFVLVIGFTFVVSDAQNEADPKPVTSRKILLTLRAGHPRLLAHAEDFEALKKAIATDETLGKWHKKLLAKGDKLLTTQPVQLQFSDRDNILEVSRQVVKRMYTLGLLYQLHHDKKYVDRAWLELQNAAQFPDWNPKHFLDTAEMTHAFAIGYDWFYPAWNEQQRNLLETAILKKGLQEAQLAYQGKATYKRTWWIDSKNNWNQVCNGGVSMGALAIAEKEPELAEAILQHAIGALPNAMQKFGPDGAWNEGPGYWDLATNYNVILLAGLESALGTDFGLEKIEGFSKTALFPLYLNGPTNKSFNFADASDETINGSQLFWLAGKFNQPLAAQLQKQTLTSPHALDLLWYNTAATNNSTSTNELPLAAYFRNTEVATMRSSWTDANAWFAGFKAGDNQANHSHLDLGSFILDAFGKRWAVDLGADSYKLPGYFNAEANGARWNYYRTRAEGHNTLVLNPGKKPDQNPMATAKITAFQTKANSAFSIADLSAAYTADAGKVLRGVALVNGGSLLVQDEIDTKAPAEIYWFMHTPAQIEIKDNGRLAILKLENEQLEAAIISPANARFSILHAVPLPTSPQPANTKKNDNIRKLTIHLTQATDPRITVEFRPVSGARNIANDFQKPLKEWTLN